MKKFFSFIIIFFSIFSTTNADFFEDTLDIKNQEFNLQFSFYKLQNPKLNNAYYQKQYKKIYNVNYKLQNAIKKKYTSNKFSYYRTSGIVRNYNNFIYYTNKYFQALKLQEKYPKSKSIQAYTYKNFINMKNYYYKFKYLMTKNN